MNKTYGSHNLQPKLTYEDVARELFKSGYYYYDDVYDEMVCTSSQQVKKIHAIHKLLNVAKYLNKNEDGSDWVPDWENLDEDKYYICFDYEDGSIKVDFMNYCDGHIVYFRTVQIARQTIEILGEEVIRTALGNY